MIGGCVYQCLSFVCITAKSENGFRAALEIEKEGERVAEILTWNCC